MYWDGNTFCFRTALALPCGPALDAPPPRTPVQPAARAPLPRCPGLNPRLDGRSPHPTWVARAARARGRVQRVECCWLRAENHQTISCFFNTSAVRATPKTQKRRELLNLFDLKLCGVHKILPGEELLFISFFCCCCFVLKQLELIRAAAPINRCFKYKAPRPYI